MLSNVYKIQLQTLLYSFYLKSACAIKILNKKIPADFYN
jgi:hypothetical protein